MAGYLSDEDVELQAEQFRRFRDRTGSSFRRWADSKDFQPEDRKAIRDLVERALPLGWEGINPAG